MPAYRTFAHRPRNYQRPTSDTQRQAVNRARKTWGRVALVVVQFAANQQWMAFPAATEKGQELIATGIYRGLAGPLELAAWGQVA